MKFQLWSTDEHGQNSIIQSGSDLASLIKRAKDEVNDVNVNNSLTAAEKQRSWEAGYIELLDPTTEEVLEDALYAGKDNTGQHAVTPLTGNQKIVKFANCDVKPRVYLGYLDRQDWYAQDDRKREINDIRHSSLQGKTFYFIRRVD
jgi:hypothetical protein